MGIYLEQGVFPTNGAHARGRLLADAKPNDSGTVHARLMEEVERELFSQAITRAHGNQAKAARWLGVSRITMREKLQHFGLHSSRQEDATS